MSSGRYQDDGQGGRDAYDAAAGGAGAGGAGGGLRPEDPDEPSGYRLRGRLGAGGMGTVYLSHTRGGQPVEHDLKPLDDRSTLSLELDGKPYEVVMTDLAKALFKEITFGPASS